MASCLRFLFHLFEFRLASAGDRYDSEGRSRWDDDWDKNKGPFPFSEKLGEISDKIGSTIDDTINRFRKKERDDSPDRFRLEIHHFSNVDKGKAPTTKNKIQEMSF